MTKPVIPPGDGFIIDSHPSSSVSKAANSGKTVVDMPIYGSIAMATERSRPPRPIPFA